MVQFSSMINKVPRGKVVAKSTRCPMKTPTSVSHRQLSYFDKNQIIGMHEAGMSARGIGSSTGIPRTTIQDVIANFKETGSCDRRTGSGRPRKTTHDEDHHMLLSIKRDRENTCTDVARDLYDNRISEWTVRRRVHELSDLKSHFKDRKPFIGPRNRRRCVKWCMDRMHYTNDQWRRFLFSDESPFVMRFRGKTRVWRNDEERYLPWSLRGTVKSDKKIMVWGCFSASKVGNLYKVDGIMEQYQYHDIIREHVVPSAQKLFRGRNWTFVQDNDPKHTAKSTKRLMKRLKIPLEDWPSQSPDLNPIENLWSYLDHMTMDRKCNSEAELFEVLTEAWHKIPVSYLGHLVDSMNRRLNKVVDPNGYPTKY